MKTALIIIVIAVVAKAERAQAAADEEEARVRRERAEAELRAADSARNVADQRADAQRELNEAESLQERAVELDPRLRESTEDPARRS